MSTCKRVPANLMLGITLQWSSRESKILVTSLNATETGVGSGGMGRYAVLFLGISPQLLCRTVVSSWLNGKHVGLHM